MLVNPANSSTKDNEPYREGLTGRVDSLSATELALDGREIDREDDADDGDGREKATKQGTMGPFGGEERI